MITRQTVEARVLARLKERPLTPKLVATFVTTRSNGNWPGYNAMAPRCPNQGILAL